MENLAHLIGGYFHQDWNHVYATRTEAVDDFVRRAPDRAIAVPAEIDELLRVTADDEDLSSRLGVLGFDDAPAEGDRAFLVDIQDLIRNASGMSSRLDT